MFERSLTKYKNKNFTKYATYLICWVIYFKNRFKVANFQVK